MMSLHVINHATACAACSSSSLLLTNLMLPINPHALAASTAFWMVMRGSQLLTMWHSICRVQWSNTWRALPGMG